MTSGIMKPSLKIAMRSVRTVGANGESPTDLDSYVLLSHREFRESSGCRDWLRIRALDKSFRYHVTFDSRSLVLSRDRPPAIHVVECVR